MLARKPRARVCWEYKGGKVFLEPEKVGLLSALARRVKGHGDAGSRFGGKDAAASDAQGGCSVHQGERADRDRAQPCVPLSLARFRQLYSSHDGRFVVFEDAQGHLTSVDSSRFA